MRRTWKAKYTRSSKNRWLQHTLQFIFDTIMRSTFPGNLYQTFCCFCVTSLCNMSSELQKIQTSGFLIWFEMTFQYWKCPQCHKSFFWKERGLPHAFLHLLRPLLIITPYILDIFCISYSSKTFSIFFNQILKFV